MSDIRLAPSLLAADFADLGGAVRQLEDIVDIFHIDVMDGHFVPNISMGTAVVKSLRPVTEATLDVHLMVSEPDQWIGPYRDAGADWISIHYETSVHLERTLGRIRDSGARAGLAINPGTMPDALQPVLADGDFIVVMSVNPGFGGQQFLGSSVDKLATLRARLDATGLEGVDLEIDGGVDAGNAAACAAAGADILVAGSSVYRADDPVLAATAIIEQARAGRS